MFSSNIYIEVEGVDMMCSRSNGLVAELELEHRFSFSSFSLFPVILVFSFLKN